MSKYVKICSRWILLIKKDEKLKYKIQEKAEELKYTLDLIIEEPSMSEELKSETIIHATALICAIVAIQPLPFADLFILSPIPNFYIF